ncbi:MAG: hypothetical protein ACOYLX_11205 [Burkholderiaceae bacterium]
MSRVARLVVPGPVWGDRPSRAEPPPGEDGRPLPAPRRGAPAGRFADAVARLRGADVATVARRAGTVAAHLAHAEGDAPAIRPLHKAVDAAARGLAGEGLAPRALALALGTAGALLARTVGLAPRDNQYRCALHLLGERLVELDTGEGKSVAVALAAGVAALAGAPVHVLTANAYLAERDAQTFAAYYACLGLQVAAVDETADDDARRRAWDVDVAYAPARLLGFDVLRDGLPSSAGEPPRIARGLCVAIVDEADAVMLDEARVPLVIAEARADPAQRVRAWRALDLARRLTVGTEVTIDAAAGTARLTPAGHAAVEARARAETGAADGLDARQRDDLVEQALHALHLLERDVHYVVDGREIVLVDANTGRPAPGRAWSRALMALVALKEGMPVPPATEVRASVTYPRLLSRYHHLCGTSGTLREAALELRTAYGVEVVRVERDRPSRLARWPSRLFPDRASQFDAALERARALAATGRCVLVATDSVADSSALAACFAAAGLEVAVLDARHDRDEHLRIARAGEPGRITVATQMAGRGTDIRVAAEAIAAGGLHVLSLQHNRSARIDRQLAGRAARQGDPGSAEHWPRLADSTLDPARLPAGLAMGVRALARSAASTSTRVEPLASASRVRGLQVALVWHACQHWWRLEDRLARADALGRDRRWSRRLHFATIREREDRP